MPVDATWLTPWRSLPDGAPVDALTQELGSELCSRHVLCGILVRPIGGRQDCDDVLFELLDGSGRFAVVHLTYARRPEQDPTWPVTEVFCDWDDFARNRMQSDHADWTAYDATTNSGLK